MVPSFIRRGAAVQSACVHVIFTTDAGTLAALKQAAELSRGLCFHVRIVVPKVVPYPLPLDHPPTQPIFGISDFRAMADRNGFEARMEIHLCRDRWDAVAEALSPQSLVVIGGRKAWWPTREKSLARTLRKAGHHVLFIALPEAGSIPIHRRTMSAMLSFVKAAIGY